MIEDGQYYAKEKQPSKTQPMTKTKRQRMKKLAIYYTKWKHYLFFVNSYV